MLQRLPIPIRAGCAAQMIGELLVRGTKECNRLPTYGSKFVEMLHGLLNHGLLKSADTNKAVLLISKAFEAAAVLTQVCLHRCRRIVMRHHSRVSGVGQLSIFFSFAPSP